MPGNIPRRGSVGEVADTCLLQVQNQSANRMRAAVRVTAQNLCPSHGALASLLVDAEPRVTHVNLNDTRMHIETEVDPHEHAVLVVHLVDLGTNTMCPRLGETEFELDLLP